MTSQQVLTLLKSATQEQGMAYGLSVALIDAGSLHPGDAMALLNSDVDKNLIRILFQLVQDPA